MRQRLLQRAITSRSTTSISPGLPFRSRANDPLLYVSCNLQRSFSRQSRHSLPSTLLQPASQGHSPLEKIRCRHNDSFYPDFFSSKAPASTSTRVTTGERKELDENEA